LLSASVVHDLGTSFCKISADSLTDEKLGEKPNKKGAVEKAKAKKPKSGGPEGNADKAKEKKAKKADKGPEDGPDRKKGKK